MRRISCGQSSVGAKRSREAQPFQRGAVIQARLFGLHQRRARRCRRRVPARRAGTDSRCRASRARRRRYRAGIAARAASATQESKYSRSRYSRGLRGLSVATRSGRMLKPCSMRPIVYGKRAAAVREADLQLRQPLQHAAEDQAAGGARLLGRHADQPRQPVLGHRCRVPIMSHGCTRIAAPSSLAASKNGNSSGASRFQSLMCEPICTPCRPSSSMQRSSSWIASVGDCSGTVPMPA